VAALPETYRLAFDHLPEAAYLLEVSEDLRFRTLLVNQAFERLVGLPAEAVVGRFIEEAVPPETASAVIGKYLLCVRTERVTELTLDLSLPVGERTFRSLLSPLRLGGDRVTHIVATTRDVSGDEATAGEFRALVEHSTDVVARFDPSGRYLYLNPFGQRILQRSWEEVSGLHLAHLPNRRQPEADVVADAVVECARTRSIVEHELTLVTPDGPRHYHTRHTPERGLDGEIISVISVARDITALKDTARSLRRINRALETLSSGNEALVRATSERELLTSMCRVLVEVGEHRGAEIAFVREADGRLETVASAGEGTALPAAGDPTDTLAREAIETGRAQVASEDAPPKGEATRLAVAAIPLFRGARTIGTIVIRTAQLDGEELRLLAELADDLSYGLAALRANAENAENAELHERAMRATIQALANTLDLRDPYTAGHQRRVTQLATTLGERLGLPPGRVQGLHFASVVHDIGKIAVPAEILTRPGRLSALEYALVQTHVEAGYDILKGVDFPWPIAEIVRQHHERLDGSGYPRGLSGEEVLIEARILAVCDVVEAMSSHRPYRPGLGLDAALECLTEGRGGAFDAEIVDACVALFREDGFRFD